MMKSILIICIMLVIFFSCKKEYFVAAESGLNLRSAPAITSKKLELMPYGSKVIIISKNGPRQTIEGNDAKWYKINYNQRVGWAFAGFLSNKIPPKINTFIAVLRKDGILIPVAKHKDKIWTIPWTLPFENYMESNELKIPEQWYYYTKNGLISKINIKKKIITKVHCLYNYGFHTDWKDKQKRESHYVRQIIGIVFSKKIQIIQKEALTNYSIDISSIFKKIGLIENRVYGDSYLHFEHLGYFKIENKIYGFIRSVHYESESYKIYEFSKGDGIKILQIDGGGC